MSQVILAIVAVLASIIGALTGVGSGIVLKTFYDLVGAGSVLAIGFYSTIMVFTMCIVSTAKQVKHGFKFNTAFLIAISLGSVLGGYVGNALLNFAVAGIPEKTVKLIQSIILFITLIYLIIYTRKSSVHYQKPNESWLTAFFVGLFLGAISIFLAIGGGPLNVSLLVIIFHFTMKESSVYSIAIVFFSQISKIISIVATAQYHLFDMKMVPLLIIASIIGSYIGTAWNQKISLSRLEQFYTIFMLVIIAITGFNVIHFWF